MNKTVLKCLIMLFIVSTASAYSKLPWNPKLNVVQGYNQCGPFSATAYLFVKKGELYKGADIDKVMPDRMANRYTYPQGIQKLLKSYGVESKIYQHKNLSRSKKIKWIRNQLKKGDPVILAIGNETYGHYITILGDSKKEFMIYDSLVTTDKNGNNPGNINLSIKEVIKMWEDFKFDGEYPVVAISG